MAKQLIKGITAIMLVKRGYHTVVLVERSGKWVDVIAEQSDGEFSHIVEGSKVNYLTDEYETARGEPHP